MRRFTGMSERSTYSLAAQLSIKDPCGKNRACVFSRAGMGGSF
jgi:hypothetical protein